MALPTATPASHPPPQVVGAAFVHQYYHILHKSPDMVHKFYQDSSILSRPDSSGVMVHVTTLQAINDKVLSFKFSSYIAELETVDSAASYKGGVFIVVTGCLTGNDNVRRKFTQSFFLAPQDKGYFVLNDIFRFVTENHPMESNQIFAIGDDDATEAPLTAAQEPSFVQENHVDELATPPLDNDVANHDEVVNQSESGGSEVGDEAVSISLPVHQNEPAVAPLTVHQSEPAVVSLPVHQNEPAAASSPTHQIEANDQPDHNTAPTVVQENGPKKSYASIVKVTGSTTPPKKTSGPAMKAKAKGAPPSTDKALNNSVKPANASETKVPSSNNDSDKNSHDAEGYSVHIRNLPYDATVQQVEEEFKKFGPIKSGGVQVRNHKVDNFCFGFVEFELPNSMQAAIQASPISIGGCQVFIEEKRTSTRVVNGVVITSNSGRGRFPSRRGGFQNDNYRAHNDYYKGPFDFRGRGGNYASNINQGYGRMDFRSRGGEFSGRGRGRVPQGGHYRDGGYQQQRVIQNGNGKVIRPVVMNQTAVTA